MENLQAVEKVDYTVIVANEISQKPWKA